MSDTRARSRTGIVVFVAVLVLLVALIVVGVIVQHGDQASSNAGSGRSTSAPSPSSSLGSLTPSKAPSQVMDDIRNENLQEVLNPPVSDEPKPSDAQIWAYEKAYATVDPKVREALLKPLVTKQYLAEDLNREPAKYKGIEVRVVPEQSRIVTLSVGSNKFTAYVVTNLFIETVRGGEVVNQFQGPKHASAWVNTKEGWRVIKNVGEQ